MKITVLLQIHVLICFNTFEINLHVTLIPNSLHCKLINITVHFLNTLQTEEKYKAGTPAVNMMQ